MTRIIQKKLVVGNWKMNGSVGFVHSAVPEITRRLQALYGLPERSPLEVVLCPSFVHLSTVAECLDERVLLGAQDVSCFSDGAYTGQISAAMLQELQVRYAIVGHSERRLLCHESDDEVAHKALCLLAQNIIPIVCVGETLAERDQGLALERVRAQLLSVLVRCAPQLDQHAWVIAYEPVWAIGTGQLATEAQITHMHGFLRDSVVEWAKQSGFGLAFASKMRIIYGGSVKAENAASILALKDVEGALVGGASLIPLSFLEICLAVR
jgi:triosephosphate isomerase